MLSRIYETKVIMMLQPSCFISYDAYYYNFTEAFIAEFTRSFLIAMIDYDPQALYFAWNE